VRKLLRYLLLNYLALVLCTLPFTFSLLADSEPARVFRQLQRVIEPADTVWIWAHDFADGHRELDCRLDPGADRQTLASKLEAAQTLLLLDKKDRIREESVSQPPAPLPAETYFFQLLSGLIMGLFFWANPAGRLARCWNSRHLLGSQIKLALAFTTIITPALPHLGHWLSQIYWEARIATVVQQPHQTFRSVRHGHQGLVVVVHAPSPQLSTKLSAALNLGPEDRLAVIQVPKPVSPPTPPRSPWTALACLWATIYYWIKTTPQQRLKSWLGLKAWLRLDSLSRRGRRPNPSPGALEGLAPLP